MKASPNKLNQELPPGVQTAVRTLAACLFIALAVGHYWQKWTSAKADAQMQARLQKIEQSVQSSGGLSILPSFRDHQERADAAAAAGPIPALTPGVPMPRKAQVHVRITRTGETMQEGYIKNNSPRQDLLIFVQDPNSLVAMGLPCRRDDPLGEECGSTEKVRAGAVMPFRLSMARPDAIDRMMAFTYDKKGKPTPLTLTFDYDRALAKKR